MSEWLTTGEMIDRLKVGEVAENQTGFTKVWFDETEFNGELVYITPNDDNFYRFVFDVCGQKEKWRILPKYVSFDEAMKAFKEGKKIWCEYNSKKDWFAKFLDCEKRIASPSFYEMLYGKWTIE